MDEATKLLIQALEAKASAAQAGLEWWRNAAIGLAGVIGAAVAILWRAFDRSLRRLEDAGRKPSARK